MKRVLIAALAGSLFGSGLAISGMTNPDKVLNFLDVTGAWDPSLMLVMVGALLIATPVFVIAKRRGVSLLGDALPTTPSKIDADLMIGSLLFGVGWGIAGYCPGPALANLIHAREVLIFLPAMLVGSQLARYVPRTH